MSVADAIRGRRTIKAYDPAPIGREVLDELFELARWAPNHHLTEPWRFRVLGPEALAALKKVSKPKDAHKLDRCPTLVVASAVQTGDEVQDEEDVLATACAVYIVLLAAHERGLAGYWRTPAILRTKKGRAACGVPDSERVLGLIHVGRGRPGKDKGAPRRLGPGDFVAYLP